MTKMNPQVTDKELVAAATQGSEAAFKKLYDKYWGDLYKIVYQKLPVEEDAKDILQETFISLWKNIHHITVNDSLGGYLYISVRNKIFNYYEKNKLQLKTLLNSPFVSFQSEDSIYNSLQTKELKYIINTIVADMPSKMKEIYLLSKEEQLTNSEIANLLTLAPQTIKNQIHQAVCRIRKELQKTHIWQFLLLFSLGHSCFN